MFKQQLPSTTNKLNNERGLVFIIVVVILAGIIVLASYLWRRVGGFIYFEGRSHLEEKALAIAEGGLDKAIWNLNESDAYTGETGTDLGEGEFDVTVTTIDANTRRVVSTGYLPSAANPVIQKTIQIEALRSSTVINFKYGVQAGNGGFILNNSNNVDGSVYANGNIIAGNSSSFTGNVWVAGTTDPNLDMAHDTNNTEYQFGHTSSIRDVAQSFIPTVTDTISEVEVFIRKNGTPAHLQVRIVRDVSGSPGGSTEQVAQGTLDSNWVTSSPAWIRVPVSTATLTAGQKYWIILDGGSNATRYYYWGADSDAGYADGDAKYSSNWSSQSWSTISGLDLNFRVYMNGATTSFTGSNSVTVGGDLYAHSIRDVTISGDAYYQTISNSTAANYYPGTQAPPSLPFPISQAQIDSWKEEAESGGIHSGDYTSCSSSLGPTKITGNLSLLNNCTLTMTGTLWIEGDMLLDNSNIIQLDSSYGGNGGVIVVSGKIYLKNSNQLLGSGQNDSFMLAISELDSDDPPAIELDNNNVAEGILYAGNGRVILNNSSDVLEITGETIELNNSVDITYEEGLANAAFKAGEDGAWAMRDGTWKELD